jgi:hypothetical protein
MKNLSSYLAPALGVFLVIISDISFVILQINRNEDGSHLVSIIFIALYNLNVFLVLWSLWKTYFDDPGYI